MDNKKIYLSILAIGMAATIAGAGTWAYFSDTVTSTDNKFTAGTLKLAIGDGTPQNYNFNFSASVKPGDKNTFAGNIKVQNIGSINGTLQVHLGTPITEYDKNGTYQGSYIWNGAESGGWHPTGSIPMDKNLVIFICNSSTPTTHISGNDLNNGQWVDCGSLSAKQVRTFTFRYTLDDDKEDNSYQGHYVRFPIIFRIMQE